jgi:hypothetical protein
MPSLPTRNLRSFPSRDYHRPWPQQLRSKNHVANRPCTHTPVFRSSGRCPQPGKARQTATVSPRTLRQGLGWDAQLAVHPPHDRDDIAASFVSPCGKRSRRSSSSSARPRTTKTLLPFMPATEDANTSLTSTT